MNRSASPFSPRTVIALLVVGAAAFTALLYAIGAGWDGRGDRNGDAHAAANGLNGFAGLARLLEAQGHAVSLSRSEAQLEDEVLLVLTPQPDADGERLDEIIEARRRYGPTLVILPKWLAIEASSLRAVAAPRGWVVLSRAIVPGWLEAIDGLQDADARIAERQGWQGMALSGTLPDPEQAMAIEASRVLPLVADEAGDILAGYIADRGTYPVLAEAARMPDRDPEEPDTDASLWPVVIVAEPDLMNNFGMADRTRAELAHAIVDAALEDHDLPIVFDLTLAGLGRSENLLTLAFTPPFLAATLSLLLAALVIAWRGLLRFGPPAAEAPVLAQGKRQLARNGAALVERARRLHLLGPPYAALVTARIADALGVRITDPRAREAAVAQALVARGLDTEYITQTEALRRARHPAELLRAAGALRTIERTLEP
jgi:hypothetical protein